ncbi:DUF4397 domain-containing protein [Alteromonas sp. H39]|uniref:DUF4397 domain-containing protein n=1 Tax=Alteromonas sp. H39 TaxID=3389876 RepID=UPI0039DF5CDD
MSALLIHCLRYALLVVAMYGLVACGGSSESSDADYPNAYLQFYNASPNGATVTMREVDGDAFGSAQFGDTTSLYALDAGEVELEFVRMDAEDKEVLIETYTVALQTGRKTLVVLSGDFSAPVITDYHYDRESLEDHFRLFAVTLTVETQSYDLYMSASGEPFSAANFMGTIDNGALTELTYWDGDDDSIDFDTGEYTLYLTQPGETNVVFESQTLDFQYDTEYVLSLRDVSGAIQTGLTIDVLLNSSTVTTITDINAMSQYRIYNATTIDDELAVTFGGDAEQEDTTFSIGAGSLSDFAPISYGDYRLTVSAENTGVAALNNKLVTLNQGESKAIIIYESNGRLGAATFIESGLPQSYDKTVNFVNLVNEYDDVDIYLVRKDETIDTAEYDILNMTFGESATQVLPSDYYEVIAVYEDSNQEQILLDRTELYGFTEDENYIVVVQPADTPTGYSINILY